MKKPKAKAKTTKKKAAAKKPAKKTSVKKAKTTTTKKKSAKSDVLNVFMLLDRTGSMQKVWDETINSINDYVDALATKALITVAVFDKHNGAYDFTVVRRSVPSDGWQKIGTREVLPRGFTPLYTAVSDLVDIAEKDKPKRAILVITTDGDDNVGDQRVSLTQAKSRLDACKKRGWEVLFLAADFADVTVQAASLGVDASHTVNVARGYGSAARTHLATMSTSYAASGATMAWSDDEKKKFGGTT